MEKLAKNDEKNNNGFIYYKCPHGACITGRDFKCFL